LASQSLNYSTKELSSKTWPDFEKLFSKRGVVGDGWWCWCTHHHVASYSLPENQQPTTRAERAVRNREKKRKFVEEGCAHGILVYDDKEPVGWCQFGPRQELPFTDHTRRYQKLGLETSQESLWRITCFVVDEEYRRKGIASTALNAALQAIKRKGGGLVESYPVSETHQGSNYVYCGTVSMFAKVGFKVFAPFADGRTKTVIMRKSI
jgi:ribosomal protein S18 acetylase RimI-like enzyme